MAYMEAVFWIKSGYDMTDGWPDPESKSVYYRELAGLLESVGWKVTKHQAEHPYPIAENGEEWLELQPLCLYGTIGKETPKRIGKLFSRAKSFRYCQIEVLSQITGLPELRELRKARELQGNKKTKDC